MPKDKVLLLPDENPYVSVTKAALQGLANAAYTKLIFDTFKNKDGLDFDLVNSQFVCPVNGLYQVSCDITTANNAVGVRGMAFNINGVNAYYFNYTPAIIGGVGGFAFDKTMLLNVGDILIVNFFQNSGGVLNSTIVGSTPDLTITQIREL